MSEIYPELALHIGGRWIAARGRDTLVVTNPATDEELGRLPLATPEDVNATIAAADTAFRTWSRLGVMERASALADVAALIRAQRERLAQLITLDVGKPIAEARAEVDTAAGIWQWNAEETRRGYGRIIPSRSRGVRQLVVHEPVGPIAAFSPWNAPLITPSRKISGALGAGCSIVIKAAEEAPAVAVALMGIIAETGIPSGTVNLLFGEPSTISTRLLDSPLIRGVTFTGSTAVGRTLAARAMASLKRVTMELGGHAPVLVFADADPELVAEAAAKAKFRNAGQICTSPTRFVVQQPIYDRFVARFTECAKEIIVGDGRAAQTQMGPLAHERRVAAMERLVADASQRSATITAGGERVGNRGSFFAPTVVKDATADCLAMNEEPFGPLALLCPFGDYGEAIAEANRLPVGLSAYCFTADAIRAARLADDVCAGNVIINHFQASLPETPFGGVGDSGFGLEGGIEGLEAFRSIKYISQA
jgi:succinate-semialdehyde dehydrogenase/glutarate-semialdehyde dehydrogenase